MKNSKIIRAYDGFVITKKDLIKVVKKARKFIKEDYDEFMCCALRDALGYGYNENDNLRIESDNLIAALLPEFILRKPKKTLPGDVWFPSTKKGKKKRLKLLKEVIKELEGC